MIPTTERGRRWLFCVAEIVHVSAVVAGMWWLSAASVFVLWPAIVLVVLGSSLVVTLPVCFFYLIGKPIDSPTSESRNFRRILRSRPALTDAEFYLHFYQGSDIPRDTVVRFRHIMKYLLGPLAARAIPSDDFTLVDEAVDVLAVIHEVESRFGILFADADFESCAPTFDNFLRLVWARLRS